MHHLLVYQLTVSLFPIVDHLILGPSSRVLVEFGPLFVSVFLGMENGVEKYLVSYV